MNFPLKAAALFAVTWGLAASAFGIPYASQLQAENTAIHPDTVSQISYILNETADAVSISLTDNGTTVATFAGATNRGKNTVTWNGTQDNAAGAVVSAYNLRLTITATKAHGAWTEIASNSSAAHLAPTGTIYQQLFDGFAPNDCLFVSDSASDFFGLAIADVTSPTLAAAFTINPDLSATDNVDGFSNQIFNAPALQISPVTASLWGMSADPDNSNILYFTGQADGSGNKFWRGDLASSATLVTADPTNFLDSFAPRAVKVIREGSAKYAYFCSANDLYKTPMDPETNTLSGAPVRITNFTRPDRYARGVDFDAAGNLYFVSKQTDSGEGGTLFRWDSAAVQGTDPVLRETIATWTIDCPDTMLNMMGPAITPAGDVYVAMISGGEQGKLTGIFYAGNTSENSIRKTLTPADCVVDFAAIGNPPATWAASTLYFNLRSDPAGNLLAIDRATQQLRLFSPPGNSTHTVIAPASQVIRPGAAVGNWPLY